MERARLPDDASFRARARLFTRWSDEDNQGVLNNAVYLTLFEEARHRYFGALGLLTANQFPFLLAQTNVVFLAPGVGGVEVEVLARTSALGRTSFTQQYRVRDAASGRVWCEGEALLVCYDPATKAKRELASEFRARVAQFEGLG